MSTDDVVLSILVICHNQEHLLPRCLDSLLRQELRVPYEILVSEDRSTDGTWAVIQQYVSNYPGTVFGFQVNSDECSPTDLSQRCGYNVARTYAHARGRYFVNVDGDDYLRGTDVYQTQLDLLERHPDCSMCMQNIWVVNDGDPLERGQLWGPGQTMVTGQVIEARQFILESLRVLNQGYVTRRNEAVDPVALYGKFFDDTVITYHHLQFGKVVYLDRCDYVYVKYPTSIDSSLTHDNRDVIYGLLPLLHAVLVPRFARLFLEGGLADLRRLLDQCAERRFGLDGPTRAALAEFDGFLFASLTRPALGLPDRVRLFCIRRLARRLERPAGSSAVLFRVLYALLVNGRAAAKIPRAWWTVG